jgi:hypothetical protein
MAWVNYCTVIYRTVPSLDEVMERQGFALAVEVFSVCE